MELRQKSRPGPRQTDEQAAALLRAERLNRFAQADAAPSDMSATMTAEPDAPPNGARAGGWWGAAVQLIAGQKPGGTGGAGMPAAPWNRLAATSDPRLKAATQGRSGSRTIRLIRSHPWLAATSAMGLLMAGAMLVDPGAPPEPAPLSSEPITDVKEYPLDHGLDPHRPADPADIGPPVRSAAAFIDSGFVASRDEHVGTVRTVPFETYDTEPQYVEQVEFQPARVSANRGAWLTGTIEAVSDVPRARFTD